MVSHNLQEPVTLNEKLDQIMAWIDLPLEERPQFISGSISSLGRWLEGLMNYPSVRTVGGHSRPYHWPLFPASQREHSEILSTCATECLRGNRIP